LATYGAGGAGPLAANDNGLLDDATRLAIGFLERPHDFQRLPLRRDRRARCPRTAQECGKDLGVIAASPAAATPFTAASASSAGTTGPAAASASSPGTTGPAAASASSAGTTGPAAASPATASPSTTTSASAAATTSATLTFGIGLFHQPTIVIVRVLRREGKQQQGSRRREDPLAKRAHGQTPVERVANRA
jgi:hypothetical protein